MCPVCCHSIRRCHGTQCHGILIRTLIAHDTYTAHLGEQNSSSLPDLVIKTYLYLPIVHIRRYSSSQYTACFLSRQLDLILPQPTNEYIVSVLQYTHFLARNVAQNTYCQTRSREGMTCDQMLRHTHRAAYTTHLVLEQPLQWLAELKVHFLGQTSHIMMTLDNLASNIETFNTVRINSALSKPTYLTIVRPLGLGYDALGLSIKHLDKVTSDNLAFSLGLFNPGEV